MFGSKQQVRKQMQVLHTFRPPPAASQMVMCVSCVLGWMLPEVCFCCSRSSASTFSSCMLRGVTACLILGYKKGSSNWNFYHNSIVFTLSDTDANLNSCTERKPPWQGSSVTMVTIAFSQQEGSWFSSWLQSVGSVFLFPLRVTKLSLCVSVSQACVCVSVRKMDTIFFF